MKKQICYVLFLLLVIIIMIPFVLADEPDTDVKITIVSDKTEVQPGDTITYSVNLRQIGKLNAFQMELYIPSGLTYIEGSGSLADNIKTTMTFDDIEWIETTKRIVGVGYHSFTSSKETRIASFKCRVNNNAGPGNYSVGLKNLEFCNENYELKTHSLHSAYTTVKPSPGDADNTTTCSHLQKTEYPYTPPTCTTKGNNKYYICNACGLVLKSDGITETTVKTETIGYASHSGGTATCKNKKICTTCNVEYGTVDSNNHINTEVINGKPATINENGYSGDVYCSDCKSTVQKGSIIPQLDHSHVMEHHVSVPATCTSPGTIEYWKCIECKKAYSDELAQNEISDFTVPINSDNHTGSFIIRGQKEATDTEQGFTGDKLCSECGTIIEHGKTIDAISNNPSEEISPENQNSTSINENKSESSKTWLWIVGSMTLLAVILLILIGRNVRDSQLLDTEVPSLQ